MLATTSTLVLFAPTPKIGYGRRLCRHYHRRIVHLVFATVFRNHYVFRSTAIDRTIHFRRQIYDAIVRYSACTMYVNIFRICTTILELYSIGVGFMRQNGNNIINCIKTLSILIVVFVAVVVFLLHSK